LTADTLEKIERLVRWATKSYADHPDQDDIQQVARIGAWRHLEAKRALGSPLSDSTLIVQGAKWAIGTYLQRHAHPNYLRCGNRRKKAVRFSSLDAIVQETEETGNYDLDEHRVLLQPDFVPGLVETLDRQEIVDEVLSYCTPVQKEAVIEVYLKGKAASQFARERGTSVSTVTQLLCYALNHYRQRHGLPCQGKRADRG
jgi:DNA-directed RNA polymerase specialized sigma24 family protein